MQISNQYKITARTKNTLCLNPNNHRVSDRYYLLYSTALHAFNAWDLKPDIWILIIFCIRGFHLTMHRV